MSSILIAARNIAPFSNSTSPSQSISRSTSREEYSTIFKLYKPQQYRERVLLPFQYSTIFKLYKPQPSGVLAT